MKNYSEALELIANGILEQAANSGGKPNYSKRDFLNTVIIFQSALMDKMYDNQNYDNMPMEDRMKMAESCGFELRKFIHTYTGLDTHKIDEFI